MDEDRVFMCRFGLRPCYIVASNKLVKQMLLDNTGTESYNGLKDFFFGLFGHSIMFAEGEEASKYRQYLLPLLKPDSIKSYGSVLKDTVDKWVLRDLSGCDPVLLYNQFKKFATCFTLRLFLGVDGEEADRLSSLTTAHWHGVISVPLSFKVSFLMSSSYRKAMEAKQQLLEIIEQRLNSCDDDLLRNLKENKEHVMDLETLKNHVLLFACALIPKALASLLTSLIDSSGLWYDEYVDESQSIKDEDLDNILLEIVRLWPPFIGGLRVANCDIELGDYHVPKGYGVFYANFMAHRDPQVFEKPEQFWPERWNSCNKGDKDKVFGFGAGPHKCVGETLMWNVMKYVGKEFVKHFEWKHMQGFPQAIKYLPVARPRDPEPVILKRRTNNTST